MLLVLTLAGCTNLTPPDWMGGGTRTASGYNGGIYQSDTGDTDGDTTGEGPVIVGSTAEMTTTESGDLYFTVVLTYEDETGEVVGGTVYYSTLVNGSEQDDGSRRITSSPDWDAETQAYEDGGVLTLHLGPYTDPGDYSFEVYIVDYNHNEGGSTTVDVTSE